MNYIVLVGCHKFVEGEIISVLGGCMITGQATTGVYNAQWYCRRHAFVQLIGFMCHNQSEWSFKLLYYCSQFTHVYSLIRGQHANRQDLFN